MTYGKKGMRPSSKIRIRYTLTEKLVDVQQEDGSTGKVYRDETVVAKFFRDHGLNIQEVAKLALIKYYNEVCETVQAQVDEYQKKKLDEAAAAAGDTDVGVEDKTETASMDTDTQAGGVPGSEVETGGVQTLPSTESPDTAAVGNPG